VNNSVHDMRYSPFLGNKMVHIYFNGMEGTPPVRPQSLIHLLVRADSLSIGESWTCIQYPSSIWNRAATPRGPRH
jgi:hypothetical protein